VGDFEPVEFNDLKPKYCGSVHVELYNPGEVSDSLRKGLEEEFGSNYVERDTHNYIFTTRKVPLLSIGRAGMIGSDQIVEFVNAEDVKDLLEE